MICVEGYKAFRGTMRIVPVSGTPAPFELHGNWISSLSTIVGMDVGDRLAQISARSWRMRHD